MVKKGRFREDLFHRLNVIKIQIPKLSERQEDIPQLAHHFLAMAAKEMNTDPKQLLPETSAFLSGLAWPGNVRQLENTCRWLTVMASGHDIHITDLPAELQSQTNSESLNHNQNWEQALRSWANLELTKGHSRLLDDAVPAFERILIETALQHTAGRRRDAATLLGWGRNTLTRKIRELDMQLEEKEALL